MDQFIPTAEFEVELLKAAMEKFPHTRWVLKKVGDTEIMSDFEMECYHSENLSTSIAPTPQPRSHVKDMDFMFSVYPNSDLVTVFGWWRTEVIFYWCDSRSGFWVNSWGKQTPRPIPHGQELEEIASVIQHCSQACWCKDPCAQVPRDDTSGESPAFGSGED